MGEEIPYGEALGPFLTLRGEQGSSTLHRVQAAGTHDAVPYASLDSSLNPAFSLRVAPHARALCPSIKNTKADR